MKNLNEKQKRFCEEYIIDLNGTQSAIRAGYSKKTAEVKASQLLRIVKVEQYLTKLQAKKREELSVSADMVLRELKKMAFIKESDFYNNDGSVKLLSELTEDQKAGLKSYTVKSIHIGGGEYEDIPLFQVHDKQKSLEMFMKHLGMYEKDNKIEVEITNIDVQFK